MARNNNGKVPMARKTAKIPKFGGVSSTALDPHLAELFSSSVGRANVSKDILPIVPEEAADKGGSIRHDEDMKIVEESELIPDEVSSSRPKNFHRSLELANQKRKRKRATADNDDLEEKYLKRLAAEDTLEGPAKMLLETHLKRNLSVESQGTRADDDQNHNEKEQDSDQESHSIPVHESLVQTQLDDPVEKASRTVFLGNVSTAAIKSKGSRRVLMNHLTSFFSELPKEQKHSIVSFRFRSTAFADASLPKKAAFAKGKLLEATTPSTNAYAVYSTSLAAREAIKRLNASVVLERHLRVDGVAHPSKVDHRRCVFVGNLGFVDDESNIRAIEQEEGRAQPQKKKKAPADVEEGLWRQFETAGAVESVRVVRDKTTRVGKGVAYVQFKNPNSVEKALLFNDQKYPPLLPRKLRVARAKSITKTASNLSKEKVLKNPTSKGVYRAKPSSEVQSLAGRAGKLFGRAGANQFLKHAKDGEAGKPRQPKGSFKGPEQIVFEGRRAKEGNVPFKVGKAKKGTKRTKRSTAFRSRMRK